MDRLKTTDTGGFPLRLDDIRWMLGQGNEGIYEALNHLLRGLGDNFIVQGVVASGTTPNVAITEGWVMLDGELLKVDAQSSIDTSTDNTFLKQTTFDASGSKTFQDLSVNDTYQKDRAVVSGLAGNLDHNGDDIQDLFGLSEWTQVSIANIDMKTIASAVWDDGGGTTYASYKVIGKTMHLHFEFSSSSTATSSTSGFVFKIPNGFRAKQASGQKHYGAGQFRNIGNENNGRDQITTSPYGAVADLGHGSTLVSTNEPSFFTVVGDSIQISNSVFFQNFYTGGSDLRILGSITFEIE